MKYIITESQQERMRKRISELLNDKFKESNVICDIVVREIDEEEYDYEIERGLKYDIFVYLNEAFVRAGGGVFGFRVATTKKIKRMLSDWLNLNENEYYISTLVKDC